MISRAALAALLVIAGFVALPMPAQAGRTTTHEGDTRCEWTVEDPLVKMVCRDPRQGMRVCLDFLAQDRVNLWSMCFGEDRVPRYYRATFVAWPVADARPTRWADGFAVLNGHRCFTRTGDELARVVCEPSQTTGDPGYTCCLEKGLDAVFSDCLWDGGTRVFSSQAPLTSWQPPPGL